MAQIPRVLLFLDMRNEYLYNMAPKESACRESSREHRTKCPDYFVMWGLPNLGRVLIGMFMDSGEAYKCFWAECKSHVLRFPGRRNSL